MTKIRPAATMNYTVLMHWLDKLCCSENSEEIESRPFLMNKSNRKLTFNSKDGTYAKNNQLRPHFYCSHGSFCFLKP